MAENPWNTGSDAQKYWIAKINHELAVCKACAKQSKCDAIDRMDVKVCQNLRERRSGV
jgi:hypothetical protein